MWELRTSKRSTSASGLAKLLSLDFHMVWWIDLRCTSPRRLQRLANDYSLLILRYSTVSLTLRYELMLTNSGIQYEESFESLVIGRGRERKEGRERREGPSKAEACGAQQAYNETLRRGVQPGGDAEVH